MKTSICKVCKQEKPLTKEYFRPARISAKTGERLLEQSVCKKCRVHQQEEKRKEKLNSDPEYRANRKEQRRKYLDRLKEERNDVWRRNLDRAIKWQKDNPERKASIQRKAAQKLWKRVDFRISRYISHRINKGINNKNYRHVFDVLGYSWEEFKSHIENQFQDGMSWDNHGEWHIDHIKPVCSFVFKSSEDDEFKQCWSLSNLRPLWAEDNLKKSIEDRKQSRFNVDQ